MRSDEREHYGLAVYCARRFSERGVPMEELVAEAEAALLWAASRFDEERGTRFSTYAIPVVLGALRELCRQNTPMHVPRSEQRILTEAERTRRQMTAALGREPGVQEIAAEMGISASSLGQMLCAQNRMRHMACDVDLGTIADGEEFENRVLCRDAIRSLPRPYAQVLWLRFVLGVSQAEAARRLGVGQPQISRWEKRGREQLLAWMQE